MNNFTINNSTVYININDNHISEAKDKLLAKLYYARNKDTMGNYAGWEKLLGMYHMADYQGMINFIRSCRGKGGKTRNECIHLLNVIKGGYNK